MCLDESEFVAAIVAGALEDAAVEGAFTLEIGSKSVCETNFAILTRLLCLQGLEKLGSDDTSTDEHEVGRGFCCGRFLCKGIDLEHML